MGRVWIVCICLVAAALLCVTGCRSALTPRPLADMRQSDFRRCIKDVFTAHPAEGAAVELRLVRVAGKKDRHIESFTLEFTGPADTPLPQGTVMIEHARLGSFPLFLSPFRQAGQTLYYGAVFSRLLQN